MTKTCRWRFALLEKQVLFFSFFTCIFDYFPKPFRLSEILLLQQGTLNGFSMMGPDTATWRPTQNGHASVFGVDDLYNSGMTSSEHETPSIMHTADLAVANQILQVGHCFASGAPLPPPWLGLIFFPFDLQNATITGATVLQSYSTFPVALGVSISCLPKNEVVETGEKYTFTTLPNTSINHPYVLYEAAEEHEEARRWTALYPAFNSNNLEEQDVLTINNCPFVFVHENHPVIELLRLNKVRAFCLITAIFYLFM